MRRITAMHSRSSCGRSGSRVTRVVPRGSSSPKPTHSMRPRTRTRGRSRVALEPGRTRRMRATAPPPNGNSRICPFSLRRCAGGGWAACSPAHSQQAGQASGRTAVALTQPRPPCQCLEAPGACRHCRVYSTAEASCQQTAVATPTLGQQRCATQVI